MVFGSAHAHHGVHTVRWYDLKECVWREGSTGERKITALEWASGASESDTVQHIWAGTRDGSLLLLALSSASSSSSSLADDLEIVDQRLGWHAHPVMHLIRSGDRMLSIDEGGKCVLFSSSTGHSASESNVKPLASFRHPLGTAGSTGIAWASVMKNKVWVAYGNGLRVYNIDDPGARPVSLTPSAAAIGAVMCGTTVLSRPGRVYTGHEGGVICTWSCSSEEDENTGSPAFIGATKVGVSDILSLVGVNDRLWSAGRKGIVSIYALPPPGGQSKVSNGKMTNGISSKAIEAGDEECHGELWKVTNEFIAHPDAPVISLVVDPFSIEKMGRLAVMSIGRDEQVKFWDGLLGTDWIGEFASTPIDECLMPCRVEARGT